MRNSLALLAALLLAPLGDLQAANLKDLRCEYRASPLGIDAAKPDFGWLIEDGGPTTRVLKQTADQALVASPPESWHHQFS